MPPGQTAVSAQSLKVWPSMVKVSPSFGFPLTSRKPSARMGLV